MREFGIEPIRIDVGTVMERSETTLYSNLITRPTGRAVRLAIESQLAEADRPSLSMIDFAEVAILDFSCADEVVAKLLLRFLRDDRPSQAFFVFRGVTAAHLDQIETVLDRQGLLAVVESGGRFYLIGAPDAIEESVWRELESRGKLSMNEAREALDIEDASEVLDGLVAKRVAFRSPDGTSTFSLSLMVRDLL